MSRETTHQSTVEDSRKSDVRVSGIAVDVAAGVAAAAHGALFARSM